MMESKLFSLYLLIPFTYTFSPNVIIPTKSFVGRSAIIESYISRRKSISLLKSTNANDEEEKNKGNKYSLGLPDGEAPMENIVQYWSHLEGASDSKNKVEQIRMELRAEHNESSRSTGSRPTPDKKEMEKIMSKSKEKAFSRIYNLGIGKNLPKTPANNMTSTAASSNIDIGNSTLWKSSGYLYSETNFTAEKVHEETEELSYDKIDMSIPLSVYNPCEGVDLVWKLMKQEAQREADREPLLVSFLFSSILNHPSLESALAFHLANRLASPNMLSTQIMALILESLQNSLEFQRSLRADILAWRDRDPACTCLPDVFLYFKGFHALETHRVAHYFWNSGRKVLAHFLQSRVSQSLQIDIHPNATLGMGIMLDHATGIVIGETAVVGHNCSILHHVTLGGSGRRGVDRHPKIGNGVLLGAGSSVLGNINIGESTQIGAGTLVITDLPAHCVAVGVPAKIIGTFADEVQPSQNMNQRVGTEEFKSTLFTFESEYI